jgi:hypothetical protein
VVGASVLELLDQGNIYIGLPILLPTHPTFYLRKGETQRNKMSAWLESTEPAPAKDGRQNFLAQGAVSPAIMLSHGCQLDKDNKSRVTVAKVGPLTEIPEQQRAGVASQQKVSMMYLPSVPGLGDCYVDFRIITTMPRELIENQTRAACMTQSAIAQLQARLLQFFTRKDFTALLEPPV